MVDARVIDKDGLTVCPECGRHYEPELKPRPPRDNRCIQEVYPLSRSYQREQLLSGLCCDECFLSFVGIGVVVMDDPDKVEDVHETLKDLFGE